MGTVQFVLKEKDVILDTGECFSSLNVLAHAQLIELNLGSECGGHGRCGKDKVLPNPEHAQHLNPLSESEKLLLTESEISSGVRLACQCFPNSDRTGIKFTALNAIGINLP